MKKRRLYVASLSLFPMPYLWPFGPLFAWLTAKLFGFAGVQAVPHWGWYSLLMELLPKGWVVAFQNAWQKPGKFINAIHPGIWELIRQRVFKKKSRGIPTILDYALFGTGTSVDRRMSYLEQMPGSLQVVSTPDYLHPLEIHIGDTLPAAQYKRYGPGVVIDTLHLSRLIEGGKVESLEVLVTDLMKTRSLVLVQIHPSLSEAWKILRGKETFVHKSLKVLKDIPYEIDFVLEVFPLGLFLPLLRKKIQEML